MTTKEELMNGFDFKKVHRVIKLTKWKWLFDDGIRIPTLLEVKETASDLYDRLISSKMGTTSVYMCGFRVSYDDEVEKVIRLEFILVRNTSYIKGDE